MREAIRVNPVEKRFFFVFFSSAEPYSRRQNNIERVLLSNSDSFDVRPIHVNLRVKRGLLAPPSPQHSTLLRTGQTLASSPASSAIEDMAQTPNPN